MRAEIKRTLERAAGDTTPQRTLPEVWAMARRLRRTRMIAASVLSVALLGSSWAAWASLGGPKRSLPPASPASPTPDPVQTLEPRPPATKVEVSEDAFAKARGWIAFTSGGQILAVDPANPTRTFAIGPSGGRDPIGWTAEGGRLLLSSRPDGWPDRWSPPSPQLWVMEADGSITPLPRGNGQAIWGAFSPDGKAVVFGCCGSARGPFVIDLSRWTLRALGDPCEAQKIKGRTVELCGEPAVEAAAWSPDGSRIAWFDFAEGTIPGAGHRNVLSFVNPDGTGLREGVANLPGGFGGPNLVWSPDGSRLAFSMPPEEDGPGQIFVINADGSGLRQITQERDNRWPTWSPDGSRIAFVRDGTLATMAPDGTDVQEVQGVNPDGPIAWNPVG
jgi:hypothetical protein